MQTLSLEQAEEEMASLAARQTVLRNYINSIYILNGQEAPYKDGEAISSAAPRQRAQPKQAPDEFTNKPFAVSARLILERRRAANSSQGPMSADEIYDALKAGGYAFEGSVDAQKNGVKIALGKNSQSFTKIPNSDLFGLSEWYGMRGKKPKKSTGANIEDDVVSEETADNDAPNENEES